MRTLLAALTHPDDELRCAGTIAAHSAIGDRIVLLWLTRGEMADAFGHLPLDEVARLRTDHGNEAAELLGGEARFLDFPDAAVEATPAAARQVAMVIAEIRPDAVLTWGKAWARGMRHPDHQATGKIVRDAITLARLHRIVSPLSAHRNPAPLFTIRAQHSTLPAVVVDVSPQLERMLELARFYRDRIGFPISEDWLIAQLERSGRPWGLKAAEVFDAWETEARQGTTLF